jgi:hypothetical protein
MMVSSLRSEHVIFPASFQCPAAQVRKATLAAISCAIFSVLHGSFVAELFHDIVLTQMSSVVAQLLTTVCFHCVACPFLGKLKRR